VKDFTHPGTGEIMVLKMFAPGNFIFSEISAPHKTCPGRCTNSALAIGIVKDHSHLSETINIGSFHKSISVTAKSIGFEVV
jgi:hypothetical protein